MEPQRVPGTDIGIGSAQWLLGHADVGPQLQGRWCCDRTQPAMARPASAKPHIAGYASP